MSWPHLTVARWLVFAPGATLALTILSINLFGDDGLREGFACLFITHDVAVARYVADRAIVMGGSKSKLIRPGSTSRRRIHTRGGHRGLAGC